MNSRRKLFVGILGAIFMVSGMIFISTGASLRGVELQELEAEISSIEAENRKLTDEIVTHTSLSEIYENQEELSYSPADNLLYLNKDTSVAQVR